jgi:hypothetical protein
MKRTAKFLETSETWEEITCCVTLKSNGGKIFTSSAVNDKNILECQDPRVFINSHDNESSDEILVACFITFTVLVATISLSPTRNP